jgi:hypothetical protein
MPLFTRENAAAMGHLGAMARWKAPVADPQPVIAPPLPDGFQAERLMRVRAILSRIDSKAEAEDDPQASSWWATAAARWSEQEFDLADRPKPGQRRPGPEKSARVGVFWGGGKPAPVQPTPAPEPTLPGS